MGMELIKNVILILRHVATKKGKKHSIRQPPERSKSFVRRKKQTIAQQTCMWRNWWRGTHNSSPNLRGL